MRLLCQLKIVIHSCLLLLGLLLVGSNPFAQSARTPEIVYMLTLDDKIISPITAEYIEDGIEKAVEHQAEAVLIQLDTPGGLLNSTHTIVKTIINAPLPVIVYVAPAGGRAGSAGVFITMAAHVAAMAPTTRIGAAHPVELGGTWPGGNGNGNGNEQSKNVMGEKVLQDTIAQIRSIARARNRNEEWAVKAVRESASLTATEAVENNVVDFVASDIETVLQKADGLPVTVQSRLIRLNFESPQLITHDFSLRQQILGILTHPILAYLLLMLGFYGILFEITNPGLGFGGIIGVLCIILALIGMQVLSINFAGLGLVILGLALFIAEAFTGSFGILFAAGLISLLLGTLMLYQTGEPYLIHLIPGLLGIGLAGAVITAFLIRLIFRAYKRPPEEASSKLVGQIGRVTQQILPEQPGKVKVYGEIWSACSGEAIVTGERVRVASIDDAQTWLLKVEKADQEKE